MAHRLADQLQAVETPDDGEDAGRVGALLATRLDEPHLAEAVEQVVEEQSLGPAL